MQALPDKSLAPVLVLLLISTASAQTAATRIQKPARTSGRTSGTTQSRPATTIQKPKQITDPAKATTTQPPTDASASPAQTAATTPKDPATIRNEELRKLQFNRRPSNILKVWSTPADNDKATEPDKSQSEETILRSSIQAELKQLERHVILGNWNEVGGYLAKLPETDGLTVYRHLVGVLGGTVRPTPAPGVARPPTSSSRTAFVEKPLFSTNDLIGLCNAAPKAPDRALISGLAKLLQLALRSGNSLKEFAEQLEKGTRWLGGQQDSSKRAAAWLLVDSGNPIEAGRFLPDIDAAEQENDLEALNLLARYFLAQHQRDQQSDSLEKAWQITQTVLGSSEISDQEKQDALARAVDLAPKVREELGQNWLEESFTEHPERGMEVLAAIGSVPSRNRQAMARNPSGRLQSLRLQHTVVQALFDSAEQRADGWQPTLNLLAQNWLREAEFSYTTDRSTSRGPLMRRDAYGNIYYYRTSTNTASSQLQPIPTGDLLDITPDERWLKRVDSSLHMKFDIILAQLFLKVSEPATAFPYIEKIASADSDRGEQLAKEFLTVWTREHNPNSSRQRTNSYMFVYGFERRAAGIPLTRSKQERNLEDLEQWVARLKKLPIELDEKLLAKAFMTSHSSAEVYKLQAIEKVFGSLDDLQPDTLAEMIKTMRSNLATVWRDPKTQKDNNTNRKEKQIQQEVLRGYQVALNVADQGLKRFPENWQLVIARAALLFELNSYRKEHVAESSEFIPNRLGALDEFARGIELYSQVVPELPKDDQTIDPFLTWFYASLGACDLGQISHEHVPDLKQVALIRTAIESLPSEVAEYHMDQFANSLFTRMSAANPAVKYSYLSAGFSVCGDHKQAREAEKVFDYYKDLVREIELEIRIDGSSNVGNEDPFGLFVNIVHTKEIERESGGFNKYLINQNNLRFSYNYGRPTEDYRDKFQEAAEKALNEQFEVVSITFHSEDVQTREIDRDGWRVTPYAYILLKSRGPEVDKIPALALNFDFLDTSGYFILPIESTSLAIDSRQPEPRPLSQVNITQTLDERQASDGKLVLEIKATGHGLVPELDELVDTDWADFEVEQIEDQGVAATEMFSEGKANEVISERNWNITLKAKPGLAERPKQFDFATARLDAENTFQRYEDADLVTAESSVLLEEQYGAPKSHALRNSLVVAAVVLLGFLALVAVRRKERRVHTTTAYQLPDPLTPFTVIGLLHRMREDIPAAQSTDLDRSIQQLEEHYFSPTNGSEIDLRETAEGWIKRAHTS